MGPGPVLGISYAVDNNRQGSHPQRDYDLAEEANITLVCEIVENATKIKNSVLRENKRRNLFTSEPRKHFRSK